MIIVRMTGGLGNQLFQYALGLNLATKHNTQLKLDVSSFRDKNINQRSFELSNFDIDFEVATEDEVPYRARYPRINRYKAVLYDLMFNKIHIKKEKQFHFDPDVLNYPDNIYLDGYWQNRKYFQSIENELKSRLTFPNVLNAEQNITVNKILNSNSVALHVRRGDYVTNKQNHEVYEICSVQYYQSAIAKIGEIVEEHPVFFIFSDDIDWARENIKISDEHHFIDKNETWIDLRLMAYCKHFIIANSTFSWWGAYLGSYETKKVISPIRWFSSKSSLNSSDIVPSNWIKL